MQQKNYPEHDDWYIQYNDKNPLSLVMLKKLNLIDLSLTDGKELPNFIFMQKLSQESSMRKSTLSAMIHQPTNTYFMITKFCQLARKFYDNQVINQFENRYIACSLPQDNVITIDYTKNSFFYQLLNNLLRLGKDPLQLFYAQHFVKLLHLAIRNIYKEDIKIPERRKFKCYRGGGIFQKELQDIILNKGSHMETLGFFSTSKKRKIAQGFLKCDGKSFFQILFQIEVNHQYRHQILDFGYAFLYGKQIQFSFFPNEKQILFNTLCSFYIKDVHKDQEGFWVVQLVYGKYSSIIDKYAQKKQLQFNQQIILPLILSQHSKMYSHQVNALQNCAHMQKQRALFLQAIIDAFDSQHLMINPLFKYLFIYELFSIRDVDYQSKKKAKFLKQYESSTQNFVINYTNPSLLKLLDCLFKLACIDKVKRKQNKHKQVLQNLKNLIIILQRIIKGKILFFCQHIIHNYLYFHKVRQIEISSILANTLDQKKDLFRQLQRLQLQIANIIGKQNKAYSRSVTMQFQFLKQVYPNQNKQIEQKQKQLNKIKNLPVGEKVYDTLYAIDFLKNETNLKKISNLLLANQYEIALQICNQQIIRYKSNAYKSYSNAFCYRLFVYTKIDILIKIYKFMQAIQLINSYSCEYDDIPRQQQYIYQFMQVIQQKQNKFEKYIIQQSKKLILQTQQLLQLQKLSNFILQNQYQIQKKLGKYNMCYFNNLLLQQLILSINGRYEQAEYLNQQINKICKQNMEMQNYIRVIQY